MKFLRFALVVALVAIAADLSVRLSARQAPYDLLIRGGQIVD